VERDRRACWQPLVIKITNGQLRTFQKYRKRSLQQRWDRPWLTELMHLLVQLHHGQLVGVLLSWQLVNKTWWVVTSCNDHSASSVPRRHLLQALIQRCNDHTGQCKGKGKKVCIALHGLETHHRATERHLPPVFLQLTVTATEIEK